MASESPTPSHSPFLLVPTIFRQGTPSFTGGLAGTYGHINWVTMTSHHQRDSTVC